MVTFETELSQSDVEKKILANVKVWKVNYVKFTPNFYYSDKMTGNISASKLWLNSRKGYRCVPEYHEFVGEILEISGKTIIKGGFSKHIFQKVFLQLFSFCLPVLG